MDMSLRDCLDWWRSQSTVGGTIPRQSVLCYVRKTAWARVIQQTRKQRSFVVSTSRFLPQVPVVIPLNDGVWHGSVRWNKLSSFRVAFGHVFITEIENKPISVCVYTCASHCVCMEVTACERLFFLPQYESWGSTLVVGAGGNCLYLLSLIASPK